NAKAGVIETFGKAVTEQVHGTSHTFTIEKGDWALKVEDGEISISTTNTGSISKITFKSTGSDVYFDALQGTYKASDRWNVKTSTQNTVVFILGFEFSAVAGLYNKMNSGFILTINVAGNISAKAIDIKAEGFPMKVNIA